MKEKFEALIKKEVINVEKQKKAVDQKIIHDFILKHKLYTVERISSDKYIGNNIYYSKTQTWDEKTGTTNVKYFKRTFEDITLDDIEQYNKLTKDKRNENEIKKISEKLWSWGNIFFWLYIIFTAGLGTPFAFFIRNALRGQALMVAGAEKYLNVKEL